MSAVLRNEAAGYTNTTYNPQCFSGT